MSNVLSVNGNALSVGGNVLTRTTAIPPFTVRILLRDGTTPSPFWDTTTHQVSTTPNVWDITCEKPEWSFIMGQPDMVEILDGNLNGVSSLDSFFGTNSSAVSSITFSDASTVVTMDDAFTNLTSLKTVNISGMNNVTSMNRAFTNDYNLENVNLYETTNLNYMTQTFGNCSSMKDIPDIDVTNVINAELAFGHCCNVSGGISAMYNKLNTKPVQVTAHGGTFIDCGISSTHGSEELAQVPNAWK